MPLKVKTQHGTGQFEALQLAKDWRGLRALCFEGLAQAETELERLRWFNNLTGCQYLAGDLLTALDASDASSEMARTCSDLTVKGHYHENRAAVLSALGDADSAFLEYAVASDSYAEAEREELVASALNNTGLLYSQVGDFETAIHYLERAEEAFKRLGDLNHLADVYDSLSKTTRRRLFNLLDGGQQ
jgi:tetratricopeptide (TPR) repeat protein